MLFAWGGGGGVADWKLVDVSGFYFGDIFGVSQSL